MPRTVDRGDCAPPVLELLPFGQSLIATHCPRPSERGTTFLQERSLSAEGATEEAEGRAGWGSQV